ncbi:MAG TPA: hypothetical protein VM899_04015, partial [Rubellimicrobium sp.]|nr:hypothetical protein [Rubellimicrobium sp.]
MILLLEDDQGRSIVDPPRGSEPIRVPGTGLHLGGGRELHAQVDYIEAKLCISERRACRALGQ